MEIYKKSYAGIFVWTLFLMAALLGAAWLPIEELHLQILVTLNITSVMIALLLLLIWENERVYWISGVTFEQAKNASSQERRTYAWRHFKRFALFTLAFGLYSVLAWVLQFPYALSIILFIAGLTAAALSTNKIRL